VLASGAVGLSFASAADGGGADVRQAVLLQTSRMRKILADEDVTSSSQVSMVFPVFVNYGSSAAKRKARCALRCACFVA
jgi:hypothetical protein